MGKFQSRQALPCRKYRCPGHGDTSHAADMGIVQLLHPIQAVLQADYQSGNSFIRRQDIGSGSQNRQFAVQ